MRNNKFYVYTLARPDGTIFYVGKGKGRRVRDHEKEARRGIVSDKCDAIREIWKSGGEVIKSIIFETNDESLAYIEERNQIALVGRSAITNCTDGGGGVRLTPEEDKSEILCQCRMCRQNPEIAEWLVEQRGY